MIKMNDEELRVSGLAIDEAISINNLLVDKATISCISKCCIST